MRSKITNASSSSFMLAAFLVTSLLGVAFALGGVGCSQTGGTIGGKGGGGNGGNGGNGGFSLPENPTTFEPGMDWEKNCGNGEKDEGEQCDDGNTDSGDCCNKLCQIESNCDCPDGFGSMCKDMAKCGNNVLTSNEVCDDGNTDDGDGCSGDCSKVEDGFECRVPGKPCIGKCGDGRIMGKETCDDGNTANGDGCSNTCQTEPGADCPTPGKPCNKAQCGNGILEKTEQCDCGTDSKKLPTGCRGVNGLFYGDAKGCSKTCTKEPSCQDSNGKTQACTATCGDGNKDPDEDCDDGNLLAGDGCGADCKVEGSFTCTVKPNTDSTPCKNGGGKCLELPIVYRDFKPENDPKGHPDFYWLGTRFGGSTGSTTVCVPNSGGPAKGNDSTARCWGIAAENLKNGKPQAGSTKTCDCQYSEWNVGNSNYIDAGFLQADSPLYGGNGYLNSPISTVSTTGPYSGTQNGSTQNGGPIFKGTTPAYKDADSFKQWFTDDESVNKAFASVLTLKETKPDSNVYHFASESHLSQGGFYPLDALNPGQVTLCNLWPYWNRYAGGPIWANCTKAINQQYLFPPRVTQADCPTQKPLTNGCWVVAPGVMHDSYFTDEVRYYFAYNPDTGISLSFFGDDDLFIFINGVLVLDLGGVHQQLPGKVTVKGPEGEAQIVEGGCLLRDPNTGVITLGADGLPTITGTTAGPSPCSPTNSNPPPPPASNPADFRVRTAKLGLKAGKVYEIAIFGADRHPPESNYELTLNGFTTNRSECTPRCGDGVVSGGEECDCGDGKDKPDTCPGPNNDNTYGGCTIQCKWGPYCGDGKVQDKDGGKEQCDKGKENGNQNYGGDGCTFGCLKPHFCGDGSVDTDRGEACDLGAEKNGAPGMPCDKACQFIVG